MITSIFYIDIILFQLHVMMSVFLKKKELPTLRRDQVFILFFAHTIELSNIGQLVEHQTTIVKVVIGRLRLFL